MKYVLVTQRVEESAPHGERRDALDQRWTSFLRECGFCPVPVPNEPQVADAVLRDWPVVGMVLTGGNSLAACGGEAPERDATESRLLTAACEIGLPVLGVCRGMQVIQHHWRVPLVRVDGHVTDAHRITGEAGESVVNSYHEFGATESVPGLEVIARSDDGVVEAVRHGRYRVRGVMWHPERYRPFRQPDLDMVRDWFVAR